MSDLHKTFWIDLKFPCGQEWILNRAITTRNIQKKIVRTNWKLDERVCAKKKNLFCISYSLVVAILWIDFDSSDSWPRGMSRIATKKVSGKFHFKFSYRFVCSVSWVPTNCLSFPWQPSARTSDQVRHHLPTLSPQSMTNKGETCRKCVLFAKTSSA